MTKEELEEIRKALHAKIDKLLDDPDVEIHIYEERGTNTIYMYDSFRPDRVEYNKSRTVNIDIKVKGGAKHRTLIE